MLVRPPLEYATCAWSPYTQNDKQCLDNIQRAAAGFVCSDYGKRSSVTQMMGQLGWDKLATRQLCRDASILGPHALQSCAQPGFHPPTRLYRQRQQQNPRHHPTQVQDHPGLACPLSEILLPQNCDTLEPAACPRCDGNHSQGVSGSGPPCSIQDIDCSADMDFLPQRNQPTTDKINLYCL